MPKIKFSYEDYQQMMEQIMTRHGKQVGQQPMMPLADRIRENLKKMQMESLPQRRLGR